MDNTKRIIEAKNKLINFKDKNLYSYQMDAIDFILNSNSKVKVIHAPTGSGKSLIGATLSMLYDNTAYLVHSKTLQQQINNDFPEMPILYGRSNYFCMDSADKFCDSCGYYKPSEECEYYDQCRYRVAKETAINSRRKVLNYRYYLTETNYIGRLSGLDLVICDEADTLENELLGFVEMSISEGRLHRYNISPPKYKNPTEKNGLVEWQEWAKRVHRVVLKDINEADRGIEYLLPGSTEIIDAIKRKEQLTALANSLDMFKNNVNEGWISDTKEYNNNTIWTFKPTWITTGIMEKYFKRHSDGMVLMSATLPPKPILAVELGLEVNDIDVFVIPSVFKANRRPIHFCNTGDMSAKSWESNIGIIKNKIIQLAELHKDEKGLIHTSNYKIAHEIVKISDRFITHDGKNRQEVLQKFIDSTKPLILVSPSMERGIDLRYDLCRWIAIAKVPYPYLGDKQVSKRLYSGAIGQYWYTSTTIRSMEQQCGRGMRKADDECVIYILDSKAKELFYNNIPMFSNYFKDCVVV